MTAAVETMAYTGEVPWHGLGNEVSADMTPKQMLKAAGIDWKVEKRPLYYERKGNMERVEGKFGLVRTKDDALLSVVGSTWKPIQNEEAMDFFTKFTEAGHMTMETAGSLWGGRYVWALARIGKDFILGKEDEVRGYLLLSSPHVHGKSFDALLTSVRVVCNNTLTAALAEGEKYGDGFRLAHSSVFDKEAKEQAETALGISSEQMENFKQAATLLSKKRAKPEAIEEYFGAVLRVDERKLSKKKDGETREPLMLPKFRAALEYAPGQNINTAAGTWWGAFNAVTYVVDHETGRDRSTALRNAWLGHTAGIKRRALNLAVEAAK